ncbi:RND efflux system, outer membrane lipoprotein, NodT family [Methylobacterium sp. 4-46]|uniref:efflux transporter outer membrane subunit n=1 Tax=unclassified Methylobacterium TaxID=2615210 RepID=UPI000152DA82|nr:MULTISPECIES: efflux transporter outer membrane subunit [Methylobacterium]ACA20866.1 RND efflux system, outer membrane lipoprotein, NodT family [Methylobacterium sp. 4-46]WFT80022.1 efflux transporter outer membrane subunit [Methylobacterium nodulans]
MSRAGSGLARILARARRLARRAHGRGWAALLLCGGCVAGPDFVPPAAPVILRYGERAPPRRLPAPGPDGTQVLRPGADGPHAWWRPFGSRRLDRLVRRGLAASPTVEQAEAALRQARSDTEAARASLLPNLSLDLARRGGGGIGPAGGALYGLYGASVAASYTPDLFGGIRRAVEAQEAREAVAAAHRDAAALALSGNIVAGAIQEAILSEEIAVSEAILRQDRDQLALVKVRHAAGSERIVSVLNQESLIRSQEAALIASRMARVQARHRLAVLIGLPPSAYAEPSFRLGELTLPRRVPLSLPSRLLARRPDIRAAAAQLHAASAEIGVAAADMLPRVTLTANLGASAATIAALAASSAWGAGLGLAQPLLDGGAQAARRQAAVEAYAAAAAAYRATVLAALQTVADALAALEADAGILTAVLEAEALARDALAAARVQYEAGAVTYADLLLSQTRAASASPTRIAAQGRRLVDTAALQQALGWERDGGEAGPMSPKEIREGVEEPG